MTSIRTIPTEPIEGQKPGTSGLRKAVRVFQQQNYTENFVQASLWALEKQLAGATLVVGGDGRFFMDTCTSIIINLGQAVSQIGPSVTPDGGGDYSRSRQDKHEK